MNFQAALRVSSRAIKSNKIRSILTTLGIIIGVAAVISLVSLTQGANRMIEEQLTSLGGKSLFVNPGKRGVGVQENAIDLTAADADAIRGIDIVKYVSPMVDAPEQVVWGNRNWFTVVVGTSPDFVYINDWYPESGVFFNNEDVSKTENVCVLGKTVVSNLFGYRDPVGQTVRIGKNSFRVIGVMSPLGQTSGGRDQDDVALIPYTTFQKRILGTDTLETISVAVGSPDDIPAAESRIRSVLRERHKLDKNAEDNFYIRSQMGVIDRIFAISNIMTVLLGSIASISLVVGGIGIMNIMLVSVGERTKEIGIRMAVGAKEKDIMMQFLIEAVLLSLTGGVIGIAAGVLGSKIASSVTGWKTVISPESILISFFFAALIGIFFGIYPARKASKLDPIEALRYE
ncbi:MAG: ABC transporter permease [Thermodesulfobacteriota bacterium]